MGGVVARVGTLLAVVVAVAGLVVVGPGATPASACDCGGLSDADAFAKADAVFVGEVVDYEPPPQASVMSSTDPARWTFEVSDVYKGEVTSTQTVVSEQSGASCGLEIPKVGEFVVFATTSVFNLQPDPGEYYAGLCGGTRSTGDGPLAVDATASPPIEVEARAVTAATVDPASDAAAAAPGDDESTPSAAVVVTVVLVLAAGATASAVAFRSGRPRHPSN